MIGSYAASAVLVIAVIAYTRRRPMWGLCMVLASIPLSYSRVMRNGPLYFLTDLVLLPFALTVLAYHRKKSLLVLQSPFLMFLPFLAYIALSVLWAHDVGSVVKELIRWGGFVLIGIAAPFAIQREGDFVTSTKFLSAVGVVVSIVGTFQFVKGINQNPFRPGAAAFFGHPNPTAAFLALCLLPALGLLIQEQGGRPTARVATLFVLLVGLIFTFSRGVLVSCAVTGGVFLIDTLRSSSLSRPRAAAILVGVLGIFLSLSMMPNVRHVTANRVMLHADIEERRTIFSFGWSIFKERPWFGLGAGNLRSFALQNHLYVHLYQPFEPNYGDLHSLYLQLMVENGIIGLALFLVGLVGCSLSLVKRQRNPYGSNEPLDKSIWAASFAFLLAGCTGCYAVKGIHLAWAVLLAAQVAMRQVLEPSHA